MKKAIELFVGIDIAKLKVDVHFYPTSEAFSFRNDDEGQKQLISLLRKRQPKRVVFESTGGYSRRLAEALEAAQIKAHCVPAQRVRMFAHATGIKAKTDPIDAAVIAHFAATAKLVDKVEVSPATRTLKDLYLRRSQLVELRTKEKNHRETMPDSHLASWEKLQDALDEHIAELDDAIVDVVNQDADLLKRVHVLETIKGCGLATCAAMLALMPELGKISGKQAAALVGVAPFNDQSGDSDKPRSIYGGRQRLRDALYMAALTASQWDARIRPMYERLIDAKKPEKVALTACMRKIVVIANARMRDELAPPKNPGEQQVTAPPKPWRPRRTPNRSRRK